MPISTTANSHPIIMHINKSIMGVINFLVINKVSVYRIS
jgi:hypothetical protein